MTKISIAAILFLFVLSEGCRRTNDDDQAAPAAPSEESRHSKPEADDQHPGDASSAPTQPSAQEQCEKQGADYQWNAGKCLQVPNEEITGTLSGEPQTIWEANTKTCDEKTTQDGTFFVSCAGFDVMIPFAKIESTGKQIGAIMLQFTCRSLGPLSVAATILDAPMSVETTELKIAPGDNPQPITVLFEGTKAPWLHLRMPPQDSLDPVATGCKVELKTNTSKAV